MTPSEAVLFSIGVGCIVFFCLRIVISYFCSRDANWQEKRFVNSENIAFMDKDDRWYGGKRVEFSALRSLSNFYRFMRGDKLILMRTKKQRWVSAHQCVSIENIFSPRPLRQTFPKKRRPSDIEDGTSPFIGDMMKEYTPVWAFFVNNYIVAFSTAIGFEVRLSQSVDQTVGFFIIFGLTFVSGSLLMLLFYYLFGYGEALVAQKHPKVLSTSLVKELFGTGVTIGKGEAMVVSELNNLFAPRLRFNIVSKAYIENPIRSPPTV